MNMNSDGDLGRCLSCNLKPGPKRLEGTVGRWSEPEHWAKTFGESKTKSPFRWCHNIQKNILHTKRISQHLWWSGAFCQLHTHTKTVWRCLKNWIMGESTLHIPSKHLHTHTWKTIVQENLHVGEEFHLSRLVPDPFRLPMPLEFQAGLKAFVGPNAQIPVCPGWGLFYLWWLGKLETGNLDLCCFCIKTATQQSGEVNLFFF